MNRVEDRPLTVANVRDILCCPGGLEVKGQQLLGDIEETLAWRKEMLALGMRGFVSYQNDIPRGFIEYMPAETAPFPIIAPGAAVLICYHFVPAADKNDKSHLKEEKRLIALVIGECERRFSEIATLGWDNPVHFPIQLLEELGFEQVERVDDIALMWLPVSGDAAKPRMTPKNFAPRDLSSKGLLAIESAWSSRCPYSIHSNRRLEQIIEEIPGKERIRNFPHRIDTHEDAHHWSISPWDWAWVFLNGEKVAIHELKADDLQQLLQGKISQLK